MAHVTSRFSSGRSVELTASGVPTLDLVLGGGLPLGSIVLIEEDEFGAYSDLFFKTFLSQGVVNCHSVFLASPEEGIDSFFKSLPAVMDASKDDRLDRGKIDEPLTIAWRYENTSSMRDPHKQLSLSDNFTFGKHLPTELLNEERIRTMHDIDEDANVFDALLEQIHSFASDSVTKSLKLDRKTHIRIGIHRLGSAFWSAKRSEIPRFLFKLRCLLSQFPASAVVTLPSSVNQDPHIVSRCYQISDVAFRLVAVDPTSNPLYSEYNGLLQLGKISSVNSLTPLAELTDDWAFKLSKKRLLVERLTLPPELDTSTQREQTMNLPKCSSLKNNLDF